jgi:hypothetical protein
MEDNESQIFAFERINCIACEVWGSNSTEGDEVALLACYDVWSQGWRCILQSMFVRVYMASQRTTTLTISKRI